MDDKQRRKALSAAYKEKPAAGGVVAIVCAATGRRVIQATPDLQGMKNRFRFSVATGSCILGKLQADWNRLGADAFSLEVLEELSQKPDQDARSFRQDLQTLEALWREKYSPQQLY